MKTLGTKEQLISVLSHDLRNPLGAILAYSELLSDTGLDPKASRQISAIRRAATRIDGMIQNIVELSRLETGELKVNRELTALGPLLMALEKRVTEAAQARQVTLCFELGDKLPELDLDAPRLSRVLEILLLNAIQASAPGRVVKLAARKSGKRFVFQIIDEGSGLSPDEIETYFGDRSHELARPGRGLSLFFARYILAAHSSSLTVKSTKGQGTRISFELPVPAARAQSPRRARTASSAAKSAASSSISAS